MFHNRSTMATDTKKMAEHMELAASDSKGAEDVELSRGAPAIDEETNRRLLRKIDMRLMPVVCFPISKYMDPTDEVDVLHLCTAILRQGTAQPGCYLWLER
jgi:hypothetical protein